MLAPYRVMVRPLVTGVSKILEKKAPPALDNDEKEGGIQAFSALIYQYGGELDARVLVMLWIAGVTVPRIIEAMEKRDTEKKKRAGTSMRDEIDATLAAADAARHKTVDGEVLRTGGAS